MCKLSKNIVMETLIPESIIRLAIKNTIKKFDGKIEKNVITIPFSIQIENLAPFEICAMVEDLQYTGSLYEDMKTPVFKYINDSFPGYQSNMKTNINSVLEDELLRFDVPEQAIKDFMKLDWMSEFEIKFDLTTASDIIKFFRDNIHGTAVTDDLIAELVSLCIIPAWRYRVDIYENSDEYDKFILKQINLYGKHEYPESDFINNFYDVHDVTTILEARKLKNGQIVTLKKR